MADVDNRDVVMENIGCGSYQVAMFLLCGCCVMAEAVAIASLAVGVPVAMCDMEMDTSFIPWSNAVLSFGAAAGGVGLGALGDARGRCLVLPVGLLAASSGLLVVAFATSGAIILFGATLLGLGLGAVGPAARVYLAEILPARWRGCVLALLYACWVAAYLACLHAWWELSPVGGARPQKMEANKVRSWSWRTSLLLGCFACLLSACMTGALRNTARHLLCIGQLGEAHVVLRHMFAINHNQPEGDYQAGSGLAEAVQLRPLLPRGPEHSWYSRWFAAPQLRAALANRTTRRGTIAAALATAAICPGWAPLLVWSSRLAAGLDGPAWWVWAGCALDLSPSDSSLYWPLVVGAGCALLVLLLAAGCLDWLGRRPCAVGGLAAGGALSLSLLAGRPPWLVQALAALLAAAVALADATLHVAAVEMYPTHSRATMAGVVAAPGRLITAVLHLLPAISSTAPCYGHGVAMLLGAAAAFFLPELKRQPLVE